MSLLNVLGRSSSFFSSAAKTIAATSNRTGTSFMISTMTRTEREEGESRPSVPLKRKEKKGSSCTLIKTGWVRFSYRHFIAVHGAGSCRPHQTFIVSHLLNHQSPKNRSRPPMLDRVSSSFLDDGRACIHLIGTWSVRYYTYILCSHTIEICKSNQIHDQCIPLESGTYDKVGYHLVYGSFIFFLLVSFLILLYQVSWVATFIHSLVVIKESLIRLIRRESQKYSWSLN